MLQLIVLTALAQYQPQCPNGVCSKYAQAYAAPTTASYYIPAPVPTPAVRYVTQTAAPSYYAPAPAPAPTYYTPASAPAYTQAPAPAPTYYAPAVTSAPRQSTQTYLQYFQQPTCTTGNCPRR